MPGPAAAIVAGLIAIASDMGIRLVAEGMETEHQGSAFEGSGCVLGQGFLFARPAPCDATAELLLRRA